MLNAFLTTLGIIAAVIASIVGIITLVFIGIRIRIIVYRLIKHKKYRKEFEVKDETNIV